MKKKILVFALILVVCITFSSSYDVRGTEELSYVIAIGIDKSDSENEPLSLTVQIAKSDSSESGGTKIKTDIKIVFCFPLFRVLLQKQSILMDFRAISKMPKISVAS